MLMWLTSKISNISTGKISFVTRIPNQTQDLNFYILPTIQPLSSAHKGHNFDD